MISKEHQPIDKSDERLEFISSAVEKIRAERDIIPTPGSKLEGSCYAARGGEMGNMFWAQLVHTSNGTGEWQMLRDPDILEELYNYASSLDL
jgi:hypothetical protein